MGEQTMHRMKTLLAAVIASFVLSPAMAADFDGSKFLVCATLEARDCVMGAECFTGLPDKVGAPEFIRIDFANKMMVGAKSNSPIVAMESSETQVLLQGKEGEYGWSFALDQASGHFSASLTDTGGSFLLFGSCTPQ
jgi:hypothetical protein